MTDHPIPDRPSQIGEGPPGQYRWVYEFNLYRNPSLLLLIWKLFFFVWLGISLFIFLLSLPGQGALELIRDFGGGALYVGLFLMALAALGYYAYALYMRGRYTVLFEMDAKGIRHVQIPSQAKKAKKLGGAAALLGLATANPGLAGAGLLAGSRQSLSTSFKKVNTVKVIRKKNTIKLRSSRLIHNQVYTAPQDFDFVLDFIKEALGPRARIR